MVRPRSRHGRGRGPARGTDEVAVAIGFESMADLFARGDELRAKLSSNEPLMYEDWRRVLLATELVFCSDVVGSGLDWAITTGLSDVQTIMLLRSIQRKLPRWRSSRQLQKRPDDTVEILDPERFQQAP